MKYILRFLFFSVTLFFFVYNVQAQFKSVSESSKLSKTELAKLRKELAQKNLAHVLSNSSTPKSPSVGVTYFTNRIDFDAANPGLTTEDFHVADSRIVDPLFFTGTIDKSTNNAAFHTGDIADGISIHPSYDWLARYGSYDQPTMLIIPPGGFREHNAHTIVGCNYFYDNTVIEFSPAATEVGFDIYPYYSENNDIVTLYDANGNIIAVDENAPSRFNGGFFGVSSQTPIAKIVVYDPLGFEFGDEEWIGNIQFGGKIDNPPPFLANMEEPWLFYGNKFALKNVTQSTTVSGPATCSGATIQITSNYTIGKDVIMLNPGTGLMNRFNILTGTLTLSGIAPIAVYQNAIRNILYMYGAPQIPWTTPNRQVSFTVYNGAQVSNTVTRTIAFNEFAKATAGNLDFSSGQKPTEYSLYQNYPNPFNPTTSIRFAIPQDGFVSLKVYNILGEEVASLVNEYETAGMYQIPFDGSKLSSGTYFYRLSSGNFVETKKFMLMK